MTDKELLEVEAEIRQAPKGQPNRGSWFPRAWKTRTGNRQPWAPNRPSRLTGTHAVTRDGRETSCSCGWRPAPSVGRMSHAINLHLRRVRLAGGTVQ